MQYVIYIKLVSIRKSIGNLCIFYSQSCHNWFSLVAKMPQCIEGHVIIVTFEDNIRPVQTVSCGCFVNDDKCGIYLNDFKTITNSIKMDTITANVSNDYNL